jgi:hypothetical protein
MSKNLSRESKGWRNEIMCFITVSTKKDSGMRDEVVKTKQTFHSFQDDKLGF